MILKLIQVLMMQASGSHTIEFIELSSSNEIGFGCDLSKVGGVVRLQGEKVV